MGRLIAISDIHGCCLTFKALLEKIEFTPQDRLVLLGDYIDRGPRSKQVLDLIFEYIDRGYAITLLKGNHEVMLLDALQDDAAIPRWIINAGGDTTLKSFDIAEVKDIPERYIHFMESLKDFHVEGQFIFVHAGLNFSIPYPLKDKESMYWMRGMVVNPNLIDYKTVIYGHTPVVLTAIEKMIGEQPLNFQVDIDNGCVFEKEGMNCLLAYFPEQNNFVVQKNID